jgi:streptogramin lyase
MLQSHAVKRDGKGSLHMCPDIDWKVEDDSGQHTIAQTRSNNRSRRRKIALGLVILLGIGLGVMYSSIPGLRSKPTPTRVVARPTVTSRPTHLPMSVVLPTSTVSAPIPVVVLSPLPASISSSLSCSPTVGSAWHSWLADQNPLAVLTLVTDHDTVWAGTSLGVRRINTQTDDYVTYEELGETDMLLPVEDGQVWAVSKRGLFFFDGSHWIKPEVTADVTNIGQLGVDRFGDLHVFSSDGRYPIRYHYSGHIPPFTKRHGADPDYIGDNPTVCTLWQAASTGSYTHRSPTECDAFNQARWKIYRELTQAYPVMAIDADQSVWWAAENILGHLSNGRSIELALPVNQIYALAPDPERGVWIGTDRGLVYTDGDKLRWVPLGLDQCTVRGIPTNIAVDTRGAAWLLTTAGDVLRFAPGDQTWTAVTDLRASAAGRPVYEIVATPAGGIWVTHGYDLQQFDGSTLVQSITLPTDVRGMHILFVDPAGIVWNLSNCSRQQFNPSTNQWTGYDLVSLHEPCDLTAPVMTSDGSFYALSSGGLIAYPRTSALAGETTAPPRRLVASIPNLGDYPILVADKRGGVWIAACQQHALWHYQNGKLTLPSQSAEWQSLGLADTFCPRQLYVDDQNRLWISVEGGLIMGDQQTFRHIPLSVGTISRLTSGPDGRIWVIGDKGVGVYDPKADKLP